MVLEEFVEKCQSGRCMRNTIQSPQCKKQYKQEQCFDKYTKKLSKDKEKRENKFQQAKDKKPEQDEKWIELKKQIMIRDGGECRFLSILTKEEFEVIKPNLWGVMKTLDGAHILSRSNRCDLVYDIDNVVLLCRYVHSCLDNGVDPFTQERISKEEVKEYWYRIVGKEYYEMLENRGK
jgi:hypothetical protein